MHNIIYTIFLCLTHNPHACCFLFPSSHGTEYLNIVGHTQIYISDISQNICQWNERSKTCTVTGPHGGLILTTTFGLMWIVPTSFMPHTRPFKIQFTFDYHHIEKIIAPFKKENVRPTLRLKMSAQDHLSYGASR